MINLYHLKYFSDAVLTGSLSQAAEMNHISHSAISQAIRALEQSLDCELLVHSKRRFEVTDSGRRIYRDAVGVFEAAHRLRHPPSANGARLGGVLRVGLSHTIGKAFVSGTLATLAKKYSDFEAQLRIGNSTTLERLLETREIEIGIGIATDRFVKFERRPFYRGNFILVQLKNQKSPPPVFIVGDKGREVMTLRSHLEGQKPPARFIEIQSWELITDLAATSP